MVRIQTILQRSRVKKVFINYALPGETVKAQITHAVKRLEEADAVQLQL